MSSGEPVRIWVVPTEVDHAEVGHLFLSTDAMVDMQRMPPSAGSAETSGWLPADATAEKHRARHLFWLRTFGTGTRPSHATFRRVGWKGLRDRVVSAPGVSTQHDDPGWLAGPGQLR